MGIEDRTGFMGIHQSFAETELGETLASRVRYTTYKPEEVTNERWEELLGADVNNLDHLALTYGLAKSMVRHLREERPDFLTPHEEDVLLVTALIHDWAEAIVGDINYNDKTPEQEAEEMRQLSAILGQHYDDDTTGIRELVLEASEVVSSPDSKLGKVFNTIERIGYMRTALRASEQARSGKAEDCAVGLKWLYSDVLGNHTVTLIERSEEYPMLRGYLLNQQHVIFSAFVGMSADVFMNYPPEKRIAKQTAFLAAFRAFAEYVAKNDSDPSYSNP
ncbi:MAG TPA: hypothetical protein VL989_01110 [Candidatus Sulfotelmatobacter sp.]|nr:hypothetical protein [Candidatus Sulfotelmatobacter sp.]